MSSAGGPEVEAASTSTRTVSSGASRAASLAGVAAGVGDTLGVAANVVRCGFLVLTLAGGLGVVLYGVGWLLMRSGDPDLPPRRTDAVSTSAFSAVVLGLLLLVRAIGPWPGDVIVWPLAAAMIGLAILSMRPRESAPDPPEWPFLEHLPPETADAVGVLFGTRRGSLARIIAGAVCIVAGLGGVLREHRLVARAAGRRDRRGRRARGLRVDHRSRRLGARLAVHRANVASASAPTSAPRSPPTSTIRCCRRSHSCSAGPTIRARSCRLARMQERELRAWLLSGGEPGAANGATDGSVGAALDALAAEIETEHGVPVEVVRVRDCPAAGLQPLLLAAREAIVNAVRHSGAANVSVYLEVEPQRVSIFVRDRGKGFDPGTVAPDRRGISGSIVDRLARAGGSAGVRSTPGEGTEVEMSMPRVEQAEEVST